jgi:hypothetical protein
LPPPSSRAQPLWGSGRWFRLTPPRTTTPAADGDGNPVANPNRSIAEKPNKPVRVVVKKVGDTIKKTTDRLRRDANG